MIVTIICDIIYIVRKLIITAKAEKGRTMDEMTREEMQRFLNREAEKGTTEYEALKALADILGITFPELKKADHKE